jgi:hypothetical protein
MSRIFGYSRVSTSNQDWSLQLDALVRYGCDDRDVFREKRSGAKADRQELRRVLDLLRQGDKLVVWRLDRLARSQLTCCRSPRKSRTKAPNWSRSWITLTPAPRPAGCCSAFSGCSPNSRGT